VNIVCRAVREKKGTIDNRINLLSIRGVGRIVFSRQPGGVKREQREVGQRTLEQREMIIYFQ
jgi:hypothetical protein